MKSLPVKLLLHLDSFPTLLGHNLVFKVRAIKLTQCKIDDWNSYLGGEHTLESLEVVALLVIIVHLQGVGGVAGVQSPQYHFTHIVWSLLRVDYNP